jgi:hypothetical protein
LYYLFADGTTTNVTGATAASACINATVVPASEMPRLLALANTPPDNSSSGSRRLQGAVDPNGPCGMLAAALAELNLVANASTFLAEVRRKLTARAASGDPGALHACCYAVISLVGFL